MIVVKADASRILPRLYQGAFPSPGRLLAACGVHVLVLCAIEHQPPATDYPGVEVLYCPFNDTTDPFARETRDMIFNTAARVALRNRRGERVLVTCRQGRNRSGLVTGIAMTTITGCTGVDAVSWIRRHRKDALTNPYFAWMLGQIGKPRSREIIGSRRTSA